MSMNRLNPFKNNPFGIDATDNSSVFSTKKIYHIWCKQRDTRNHITTIEELDIKLDHK